MLSFVHVVPVPRVCGVVGEPVCLHRVLLHSSVCSVLRKTQELHHRPGESHTDSVLCDNLHAQWQECKASCCVICRICLVLSAIHDPSTS